MTKKETLKVRINQETVYIDHKNQRDEYLQIPTLPVAWWCQQGRFPEKQFSFRYCFFTFSVWHWSVSLSDANKNNSLHHNDTRLFPYEIFTFSSHSSIFGAISLFANSKATFWISLCSASRPLAAEMNHVWPGGIEVHWGLRAEDRQKTQANSNFLRDIYLSSTLDESGRQDKRVCYMTRTYIQKNDCDWLELTAWNSKRSTVLRTVLSLWRANGHLVTHTPFFCKLNQLIPSPYAACS